MARGLKPDHFMSLALQSARAKMGKTFPNPSVGAVIWKGGRVLARGATQPPGGPHAERVALSAALRRHGRAMLRGASMAVTLEPCCFEGRTGPCTEAIIEAGVKKVYVGAQDPHKRVSGRGIKRLRKAGVEVVLGVRGEACSEHHRGFFSLCERARPFVTLKLASSLDGRIATRSGESRWITGPEARAWVHRLRARSDGVMVGSETAVVDDPELTARRGGRIVSRPVRILVDSRLRVSPQAKLFQPAEGARTLVLTRAAARGRTLRESQGAELIDLPGKVGALDLRSGLESLGQLGLTTVLVEGGGGLAAALLRANLVDEIHWILAARLIGGDGRSALGSLGVEQLCSTPEFEWQSERKLGADLHIQVRPVRGKRKGSS